MWCVRGVGGRARGVGGNSHTHGMSVVHQVAALQRERHDEIYLQSLSIS